MEKEERLKLIKEKLLKKKYQWLGDIVSNIQKMNETVDRLGLILDKPQDKGVLESLNKISEGINELKEIKPPVVNIPSEIEVKNFPDQLEIDYSKMPKFPAIKDYTKLIELLLNKPTPDLTTPLNDIADILEEPNKAVISRDPSGRIIQIKSIYPDRTELEKVKRDMNGRISEINYVK